MHIHNTVDALAEFPTLAKTYNVSKWVIEDITKTLTNRLKENQHLL